MRTIHKLHKPVTVSAIILIGIVGVSVTGLVTGHIMRLCCVTVAARGLRLRLPVLGLE